LTAKSRPAAIQSFTAIKSVNRSAEVKTQLVRAIEEGVFAPGAQLPSERELGEAFGVSRVSVREAIRALEAVGLVEVFHGRGCFVSRGPVDRYPRTLVQWLRVHRSEVIELLKVRGALDALAAAEAATRGTEEQFARLRELSARFAKAAEVDPLPLDELVECDLSLHMTIAEASNSGLLRELLANLNDQLTESRKVNFALPGRLATSLRGHAEIVSAIVERRPDDARAAAARHMMSGEEALVDALESTSS
jgi:GntR family transcriptional repressor for pyruvate dehydrogenase complex